MRTMKSLEGQNLCPHQTGFGVIVEASRMNWSYWELRER